MSQTKRATVRCPQCQKDVRIDVHIHDPGLLPGGGLSVPVTVETKHHCGDVEDVRNLHEPDAASD